MNISRIQRDLESIIDKDAIFVDEPMSKHTSFNTGGPCDILVMPKSSYELRSLMLFFSKANIPFVVLGKGSNVLVSDKGIRGAVIKIAENFNNTIVNGNTLIAESGVTLKRLVTIGHAHGLTGIETLAGIPGTVGGGICMNAGAYGGQIKDKLIKVELIDENFDIIEMDAKELSLSYRTSIFCKSKKYITKAYFKLDNGDMSEAKEFLSDISSKRKEKQPLNFPSAGSTFKRPVGHYAAQLIDEAGLKGYNIGGACVSELHAGFVINKDCATSRDIYNLIINIQEKIYMNRGIKLETEVKLLGEF